MKLALARARSLSRRHRARTNTRAAAKLLSVGDAEVVAVELRQGAQVGEREGIEHASVQFVPKTPLRSLQRKKVGTKQSRAPLKWRAPESGRGIRRACGGSGEEPPLVGEPSSRVAAFRWRRTLIYSTKAACRAITRFRHWHLGGYRRGHIVPFLASFYLPPAHTCCSILGTQAETSASRSVRR